MGAAVQQGDDEDRILERAAAIDVAKATGMVCVRVPHASIPGRRLTKTWAVSSTTKGPPYNYLAVVRLRGRDRRRVPL